VTSKDIAEQLASQGMTVDRRKIQLPQSLKELGTFPVPIKLHRDVVTKINVTLVKQVGDEPVAEEPAASAETPVETTETE
jgi:large subunit ribosomal protein L9